MQHSMGLFPFEYCFYQDMTVTFNVQSNKLNPRVRLSRLNPYGIYIIKYYTPLSPPGRISTFDDIHEDRYARSCI